MKELRDLETHRGLHTWITRWRQVYSIISFHQWQQWQFYYKENKNKLITLKIYIEIITILKNLSIHKALGPDEHLQYFEINSSWISSILTNLFQASVDQGILSPNWKIANILPIFKEGDCSKVQTTDLSRLLQYYPQKYQLRSVTTKRSTTKYMPIP